MPDAIGRRSGDFRLPGSTPGLSVVLTYVGKPNPKQYNSNVGRLTAPTQTGRQGH